ncbi:hypothetical protein [Halalkalicoccus jeotgali]|uniref:Small CPxCG-related zinc finger protein n=1 Tax=Halalkalicoccus jeotgali (strain DSM 18796 / CECT 7217 / JCM 14584 / KCTC 4019 / B3) TaxID=795797 RepID=D8J635_HALJB|nr:hypothetical protein [Halalkalicoccus jeotgali]ADJ15753.1 hypothetical protein HacjB3_11850 [Halalkalicoccus jeotgali B3]ELY37223.1 hypothetical protein C497_10778 [Halalkalicoccus jeotgali B3]
MAHTPETPERYVCTNCLVISAGVVEHVDDGHRYTAPARCGACGEDEFVVEGQYTHHHTD